MIKCPQSLDSVSPAYFLNETIPLIKDSGMKSLLERYSKLKSLTFRDAVIIIVQLLPRSTYNDWPSVSLNPPLKIPSLSSFNNSFSAEWWYFNANGFVQDDSDSTPQRFYMLRVMKRLKTKFPSGTENLPWLMSDSISIFIKDKLSYSSSVCAPCYSDLDGYENISYPCFILSGPNPGSIKYYRSATDHDNTFTFGSSILNTEFSTGGQKVFSIKCSCNKSVLLQGPHMNGLDPPSYDMVSKVSGASYLYYSFPSWKLENPQDLQISDLEKKINYTGSSINNNFQLWLDHQGGVVKEPKNKLIGQLAIVIGARPLVFPGWNWFSIQFFDNTQFTGYSNKPWDNNIKNNKQMLKGSWFTSDNKLSWISGTNTVTKWWRSPDSNTPFGTEYIFDLGSYGTYTLKGIMDDQRASQEGIENYEGGCDVYRDGKLVGVGNLECVGWPSIAERVKRVSNELSSPLTPEEVSVTKKLLKPDMTQIIVLIISIWLIISILICVPIVFVVKYKTNTWYGLFGIPVVFAFVALVILLFILLIRVIMCNKLKTCAINYPSSGCLFNCKG